MLLNNFFTYTNTQREGNAITTDIALNAGHEIFKGHFPNQPIVPGVCMMQMVKEVVEGSLAKNTKLLKADDLKFLAFVTPEQDKLIQMELKLIIDAERIKVDARMLDGATVLFKFKGMFAEK